MSATDNLAADLSGLVKELTTAVHRANATATTTQPNDDSGDPLTLAALLPKILAGFFTGVGAVALVAVLGAAVLWVRFYYAGIPPEQAVAAIPKDQLIVSGTEALVIFVPTALAAVAFVYMVDHLGNAGARTCGALTALVGAGMIYAVWAFPLSGRVHLLATLSPNGAKTLLSVLLVVAIVLGAALIALRHRSRGARITLIVLFVLELIVAIALLVVVNWALGATLLAGGLIGLTLLRIADVSSGFLVYGVTVFLAVPIFGAVAIGLRVAARHTAQPIAVLRKDQSAGTVGLYVTETSDRVYFARASGRASQGILLWVPKNQVIATAIGRLQDLRAATAEEAQLLATLKAANPAQPAAPSKETVVCTLRDNSGDVIERRTYTRKLGAQPAPCEENGG